MVLPFLHLFFVAVQTTMPVWQNWWNWRYLAIRILVVAGTSVAELMELTSFGHKHSCCCTDHYASVAELVELTLFGHMHSCSFVCMSFSKHLLKKSWSDLYSSWNTDLPSSRLLLNSVRFWRLVLRKIIVVYTKFFIWQFLIEPVLSVGVHVGAVCHVHWCCMPVPSPNRGDFVWEADWPSSLCWCLCWWCVSCALVLYASPQS